jgi:hypothetical protein
VADFFLLGFLGGHPAEEPYITASRLASVFYFGFFIVILPLASILEQIIVGAEKLPPEYREPQEKKVAPPERNALDSIKARRQHFERFVKTYQEEREFLEKELHRKKRLAALRKERLAFLREKR